MTTSGMSATTLPRLACLGRITCPHCGRDSGVMTGWRMWPHRYGPPIPYRYEDTYRSIDGATQTVVRTGTAREECPGGTTDAIVRAALRLTEVTC